MEKPIDLKTEELKQNLLNVINESKLPVFIVELILKDIYNEVLFLKNNELMTSKEKYEEGLKNTENTEK